MKNILKNKSLWIGVAVILVLVLTFGIYFAVTAKDNQVSNKLTVEQAQEIVNTSLDSIAKSTAQGAKYILDNTKITVSNVEYGYEKDVILSCSYTALDVNGALANNTNSLLESAYRYFEESTADGKKINATKINLHIKQDIVSYLEAAQPISGEITLIIYETVNGMQLYLNDAVVDTLTGGLVSITNALNETTSIVYNGETIDITNKNTLRTGIVDCIALESFSSAKPVTGNAIIAAWQDFQDEFYRNFIEANRWQYLVNGLGNTLAITFLAALMGILLGFIVAVIRCTNQMTGKLGLVDKLCRVYLTITRGTPVMVQLLILFFVFLLPLKIDKFIAAVICFGLNSGAYVAEIVRGGIMSVDKGQIEAGRSLGFNYVQTMVHFVLPQAFKAILPSLANEFITLLKESSVAFYIGVADLTQGGLKIRSITYSNFMPLIAVAVIYLVLVMILTKLVSLLERRLAKSDH